MHPTLLYHGFVMESSKYKLGESIHLSTKPDLFGPVEVQTDLDTDVIDGNQWVELQVGTRNSQALQAVAVKVDSLAEVLRCTNEDILEAYNAFKLEEYVFEKLNNLESSMAASSKDLSIPGERKIRGILARNPAFMLTFDEYREMYQMVQALPDISHSLHLSRSRTKWPCSYLNLSEGKLAGSYFIMKNSSRGVATIGLTPTEKVAYTLGFDGEMYAFKSMRPYTKPLMAQMANEINEALLEFPQHFAAGRTIEYDGRSTVIGKDGSKSKKITKKIGLLMPYYCGGDLETFYKKFIRKGRFRDTNLLPVAEKITEKIALLHRLKIVHGDIKLENFLLNVDFNLLDPEVKLQSLAFNLVLADFETAVFSVTKLKENGASPGYVDPNFYKQDGKVRFTFRRSFDIWSLGVVLATLFHGAEFDYWTEQRGGNFGKLATMKASELSKMKDKFFPNRHDPGHIDWIINKCLRLNPNKRPTAAQVHDFVVSLCYGKKSMSGPM